MLKVQIGGTLESQKDRPELVACKNNTAIEGNANQYEVAAVAEIIATALTKLLPSLMDYLGTDGVAKFAMTMNEPFMEWAESGGNQK